MSDPTIPGASAPAAATVPAARFHKAPALRPLELAVGVPLGAAEQVDLPSRDGVRPDVALSDEVLTAVARPPCAVAFSGGRDSSGLLAIATQVARREGLPDPIPVTFRFSSFPTSDESRWQDLVVEHLTLRDWEILHLDAEADILGDLSIGLLRKHGLLWPPNAHLFLPALGVAEHGSLITGIGGDELLGNWRWQRLNAVLGRHIRPRARDLLTVGIGLAPDRLRRRIKGRELAVSLAESFPWLWPGAIDQLVKFLWRGDCTEPLAWERRVPWIAARRHISLAVTGLSLMAGDRDVQVSHPLLAPRVLTALAGERTAAALGRAHLMRVLFAAVLPEPVLKRSTKADVTQVIWGSHARRFAEDWTGDHVDPDFVDPERLRQAWLQERPPYPSSTLLRAAWLATADGAR